jgi:pimeloyl-ACP methyl ester carboxylesterase
VSGLVTAVFPFPTTTSSSVSYTTYKRCRIFHGDLDFYFGGWDGRERMASINTAACPVYMLTGEYDWSNTPEMAQKTADKIPGAMHKSMPDLGHFPATENPAKFVPHLIEAIDHIQKVRGEGLSNMRLGDGTD